MEWLPKDATCVSWSMTDRKQLIEEAAYKCVDVSGMREMFENWIDAQAMFSEKMDSTKAYRLDEALIASDIYQNGLCLGKDGFGIFCLEKMLKEVPGSYDDFIRTVMWFAKKDQIYAETMKEYIRNNPAANSSDVLEYLIEIPEFFDYTERVESP